ncbi:hypothetical protein K3725_04805 [Leisingera sp. S132]|uniref:hypothetical protein n=1 Tax=Leisingera sp. S132 TaxID=2867016 RepID=UPI0021A36194|nr:hypothetical protein [Leisingera sp. S132]UWQ80340.1 hypothetical protein K3725_04805 [Leisingera sp. S132]
MTLPETMKAMELTSHRGLDKYEWHEDWPVPQPGPLLAAAFWRGVDVLKKYDLGARS